MASSRAEILASSRVLATEALRGGGFRVTIRVPEGTREVEAAAVVGADGARSTIRRRFAVEGERRAFAIQEWFPDSGSRASFVSYFDREVNDFYSWVIPKRGMLLVGGAFDERARPAEKLRLLKERLSGYGFPFADGEPLARRGAFVLRPRLRDIRTGTRGLFLVGEAAGFVSPSSAEGVSFAILSAVALARAFERGIDGAERRYAALVAPLVRAIAAKNLKAPFMHSPAARGLVMRAGIGALRLERAEGA